MGEDRVEKNYLNKRIIILIINIIIPTFLIVTYSIVFFNIYIRDSGKVNKLRVATSIIKEDIKDIYATGKNDFSDIKKKHNEQFAVINLNGEVIESTIDDFIKGSTINIESSIGYDNSFQKSNENLVRYSIPLVINKVQKGIIVVDLKKEVLNTKEVLIFVIPIALLVMWILVTVALIYKFIKSDIIKPIKQLHKSAKEILIGNYEESIKYDFDGEVGSFCHDFEEMRDELKYSKEREESLKKSEKELLACISHDLKTPLCSITGYVEGIRDGVVKEKEGIERYSNIVLKKSKELGKLIDDILEQSKTDLNEIKIIKNEIYANKYLKEIFEDLEIELKSKNRNFIYNDELPDSLISIDRSRINQVINNIITNAVKYSNDGGTIKAEVQDYIDKILISIEDNGIGISESDQPYIFEKFYRADKHRNMNIVGSGLGLSIAKHIVEIHGGRIYCLSKLGKGTKISFTIPKL